jgi:hypothetical protein
MSHEWLPAFVFLANSTMKFTVSLVAVDIQVPRAFLVTRICLQLCNTSAVKLTMVST